MVSDVTDTVTLNSPLRAFMVIPTGVAIGGIPLYSHRQGCVHVFADQREPSRRRETSAMLISSLKRARVMSSGSATPRLRAYRSCASEAGWYLRQDADRFGTAQPSSVISSSAKATATLSGSGSERQPPPSRPLIGIFPTR